MCVPSDDDQITTGHQHLGNGNVTVDESRLVDDTAPQFDPAGIPGHRHRDIVHPLDRRARVHRRPHHRSKPGHVLREIVAESEQAEAEGVVLWCIVNEIDRHRHLPPITRGCGVGRPTGLKRVHRLQRVAIQRDENGFRAREVALGEEAHTRDAEIADQTGASVRW